MGTTYMDFGTGAFYVDGEAPLTQEQVDSVWLHLPTTGASWVERGHLFVQERDGSTAFNLGPVMHGIKGVSNAVRFQHPMSTSKRHHATKKSPACHSTKKTSAQLQHEIDEALARRGDDPAHRVVFGSAEHNLSRAREILSDGLPHIASPGDALWVAFKKLQVMKEAAVTKISGGDYAVKTTDKSLW